MKMHTRISLTVVAVSVLGTALVVHPLAAMTASPARAAVVTDPTTGTDSCRLIDFDTAQYVVDPGTGDRLLEVSGIAPYPGTAVTLELLTYIQQPEYWGVEVMGCMPKEGLPVMTPFTVTLDIALTSGTLGMEIIGANASLQLPFIPVGTLPFN